MCSCSTKGRAEGEAAEKNRWEEEEAEAKVARGRNGKADR